MLPVTKSLVKIPLPFWKARSIAAPLTPEDLRDRYLSAVYRYVVARIGVGPDAEDVTADVFAAAFTSFSRCPQRGATASEDPARAWMLGIARRKVADVLRRKTRRPETPLMPALIAPEAESPESRAMANEAARALQTILNELSEIQREALRLKYIDELSLVEIGLILGKSPVAVGQLLHRARQAARTRGSAYFGDESNDQSHNEGKQS